MKSGYDLRPGHAVRERGGGLSDSGDQLSCFTQADIDLLPEPN
jgi:hypothetical protein